MNYQKSNLETLCDIAVPTMPSLFLDRHFDKSWIYCPTVEDFMSLLKFGYALTRTAEGNWSIVDTNTMTVLYLEKTALGTLFEAWIDRRYLFEDMAGK